MTTHSTAYVPTNRAPNEYIMSEGSSDGMLDVVGLGWYRSTPRMDEATRATLLLGGSPVFAPAGSTNFVVKESDYLASDVADAIAQACPPQKNEPAFLEGVNTCVAAIERGDWTTALSTRYGQLPLEEKMSQGFAGNTVLTTILDRAFPQADDAIAYDLATLVDRLKVYTPVAEEDEDDVEYDPDSEGEPDIGKEYFLDSSGQWWGSIAMPDGASMWIPLVVAFAIENIYAFDGYNAFEKVQQLHHGYPDVYAKDIKDLAQFEAARSA